MLSYYVICEFRVKYIFLAKLFNYFREVDNSIVLSALIL